MKRLGRGLSSILEDAEAGYLKELPSRGVEEIEVSKIKPNPYQPRREFNEEAINELANSIRKYGLLQPIVLIKDEDEYILVAGERRLRATKLLGEEYIKAIVVDYSKNDLREYALIENIQREDLNPIEVAYSLQSLIEEHGYTHEELANAISKSRSYVTNLLRILNLPEFVHEKIKRGILSVGHAKVLIGLDDELLKKVIEEIEKKSLNVRDTEKLIQRLKNPKPEAEDIPIDKRVIEIADKFKKIGLKVEINKDSIKIKFKNNKDLKKLEKLLNVIG
ncbi:stage 0 sporulation protein j [Nautilia profundicola AmH]|uniref:Stage 0 sporulation protein j n=1 Tax=Nautilia profundicola (strain ATCC BAA-1463 / DSM 18972 / AmH) TaxID=598659 RepID=B9L7Y1_NAUPA|nr:ParB/RepB/Spo0J family partition protein [Nautilia profundicola]ACM92349.1 stage 0 sporulation protein j [Nautilia profundicola AmH]